MCRNNNRRVINSRNFNVNGIMKKEKFYFEKEDSEVCYTERYFVSEEILEAEVYEAIKYKSSDVFWCRTECFCGDDSKDTCGKQCRNYEPRNGKSGCCKSYTKTLYMHGEKVTLKFKR